MLFYAKEWSFVNYRPGKFQSLLKFRLFAKPNTLQTLPISTEGEEFLMLLDVVVTFPLFTDPVIFNSSKYATFPQYKLEARQRDYITSLQRTLSHSYVSNVHLLYDQPQIIHYIEAHVKTDFGKLRFHKVKDNKVANIAFEFVFSQLRGRLVMLTQADVYPGQGLELIKKDIMVSKKLVYALTRHGRLEKNCDMRGDPTSRSCSDQAYRGSHDAYIFVPEGELPQTAWEALNHTSHYKGIDNVIIYTFKDLLKYKVLNPCKVIYVYHFHCSGVRPRGVKRINGLFNFTWSHGRSIPTDKLF
ncbi:hypothetical protein SNE40_003139 [Patella caerulea]|uniref:Uncharacterized protein n=1 Tax=Patella caerulea TaxID=87958 RepID=A0AAN8K7E3_PATCE